MKPHLPSRLRSALLTALASVSIPTLTAASLVTFSTQAAAEYNPGGTFQKTWTSEDPTSSFTVPAASASTVNKTSNVIVNGYTTGNPSTRTVSLITQPLAGTSEDAIYYADLAYNFPTGAKTTYFVGADGANIGSMYIRQTGHGQVAGITAARNATLSGSTYIELAGNAQYTYLGNKNISGANNSTINGSCTIFIQNGNSGTKISGCEEGSTVSKGTFLEIMDGTFTYITAGAETGTGNKISGGTHLVIHKGTFNSTVTAGNRATSSEINDGVYARIEGGTFKDVVVGGSYDGTTVNGDIDLTITGGTFQCQEAGYTGIYAAGLNGGTINDSVSLTIRGNDAIFGDNYIISAGGKIFTWKGTDTYYMTYGERVSGKVVLAELTEASSLLNSSSSGIQVRGLGKDKATGREMSTELEMNKVKGKLNAKLSDFTSMKVTNGSELKIDSTNADLGGVKSISVDGNSTLELEKVDLTTPTTGRTVSVTDGATLNLVGMEQGVDGVSIQLSIDNGTFGVYTGSSANPGADDSNVGNLTLAEGSKITIGTGGGKLEANLTTVDGSILDFSSGAQLTMGCDLTLADGTCIVLSEDNFDTLQRGGSVTLFTSIDTPFDMDDASSLVICRGTVGAETLTGQVSFHTDAQGNGMLVTPAPEPTTGTLSLLALAGLCARRRRKH